MKTEGYPRTYARRIRQAVQWAMLGLILYGGVEFYLFVAHYEAGAPGAPPVARPMLVDGFLPIGGLMSIKLWLMRGVLDPVHPGAPILLASALLLSVALVKGFCGWICPVGTISEALHTLGRRIMGRTFDLPRWVDYPLRSLKYVLLMFFLWIVAVKMPPEGLLAFMHQPYWKVSDVKMLRFFTEMSMTVGVSLAVLVGLSVLVKNFWCRYLCPYGALTGIVGLVSPARITRTDEACIHCGLCTKHCPNRIDVEAKTRVRSPECTGCMTCVSRCPAKGALDVALPLRGKVIGPMAVGAIVVVAYFALVWAAMGTGHWGSAVTDAEYRALVPRVEMLEHP